MIKMYKPIGWSSWASIYQEQCNAKLTKFGMPSKKSEYWRFSPPELWDNTGKTISDNSILIKKNNEYKLNKPNYSINFVDGKLDLESFENLKNKLTVCEISEFNDSVNNEAHWAKDCLGKVELKAMKAYQRPFALLNGSMASQGIFLKCKESLEQPLHIFYLGKKPINAIIRNLFVIENGINLQIVEHFSGNAKYNVVSEVIANFNSSLTHNRFISRSVQNSLISHFFANCMNSSSIKTVNISLANSAIRNEIFINLEGSRCNATVAGLGLGSNQSSLCDNTVFISHQDEFSQSRQIIKNVLSKGAKAVFQGKIYVDSRAQKTDGYQMSNGLILDESSHFLVKPELEIYADDVACSHGSISGSLNQEHLFYLKSRGICENDAKNILINAFLEEIIDEIEDSNLARFFQKEITEVLV